MSGFGFSPTDVANGISIVVKARRALRATGGSASEYQQAVHFLSSLELTLKSVHETVEVFRKQGQITVLEDLAKKIERPLHSLLTSLKRFEADLGPSPISTIRSAYVKLTWAFEACTKVKELQDQLTLPLLTVNLNIAILSSTTLFEFQSSIPAAVCAKFQETISSEAFVQTQKDLIDAQISRRIPDAKLSRELQVLATSIPKLLNEGLLRYETLLKDDINQQKQLTNDLTKAMDSMRELSLTLHRSTTIQARPRQNKLLVRQSTRLSPLLHFIHWLSSLAFVLSIGLRILLQQVISLLDPRTKALLAKMTTALVTVPRTLMTESIFFHDVLGYTHTLPFDYFQEFKILDCWLRDSLSKRPGAQRISESQYRLLQQSSNSLIKHTEWREVIKPNETILMSVVRDVVPAEAKCCPRCRSSSQNSSTTEGQECASCLLYYYPDPSAQYEIELWKDNFYGLQDRNQSTLFDHGELGAETEALATHSRNPDISSFKRVHTREVDLPALWLETILSLLSQILDCQGPDTAEKIHASTTVSRHFAALKSSTKTFYESAAILTALSPVESTFWKASHFRQQTEQLFVELREHLLALRTDMRTNSQPVPKESQILSNVQQCLRTYTANVFEHGSAPSSAISSLHKVRRKLSSNLKSYDRLLAMMRDYHIQVVTIHDVLDAFSDKLGEVSTERDADMSTIITTLVNAAKESHVSLFDGTLDSLVTGMYEDKTTSFSAALLTRDRDKLSQSPEQPPGTRTAHRGEIRLEDRSLSRPAGHPPRNRILQHERGIRLQSARSETLIAARAECAIPSFKARAEDDQERLNMLERARAVRYENRNDSDECGERRARAEVNQERVQISRRARTEAEEERVEKPRRAQGEANNERAKVSRKARTVLDDDSDEQIARAEVDDDSDDSDNIIGHPSGTLHEYRSFVYSKQARQPEYFLPGEGLNREVLQLNITRYLGQDTIVRPTIHEGRPGYLIRSYRPLTSRMIRSLKEASDRFELEKGDRSGTDSRTTKSYLGSDKMDSRYRHEADHQYRHGLEALAREARSHDRYIPSGTVPQTDSMKVPEISNAQNRHEANVQHHPKSSGGAATYDHSTANGALLQLNRITTSETSGPRTSQTLNTATPTTSTSDSATAAKAAQAAWARK